VNIMGGMKKVINEAGKIIIIPKKEKPIEPKDFIRETPDEYANRLIQRRNRRY